MTTTTGPRPQGFLATASTMALREFSRYRRLPQLLLFTALQPLLFLLLFSFVLGGAMEGRHPGMADGGGEYINFLLPGILVMGVTFASAKTGVAAADEIRRGVLDRMRALPVSRAGLLGGRVLADAAHNLFTVTALTLCGMLIGFRPDNPLGVMLAFLVLVSFGIAFSWAAATAGLIMRHVEAVQAGAIVFLLPLAFLSSTFASPETMPTVVRAIASVNPVTWVANASRGLMHGDVDMTAIVVSLTMSVCLSVLFASWALRRLNRL